MHTNSTPPGAASLCVLVIDAARGRAADGVHCLVERQIVGDWHTVTRGTSDAAGMISAADVVGPGVYRIELDVDPYFATTGMVALMPKMTVTVRLTEAAGNTTLRAYITSNSQFSLAVRDG
jgi:5-hydroxyisourate hydrolase-like protein (transthyretin family)